MTAALPVRPALLALAPMVRAGTTPLRLLALQYGADLVYTEEIIDRRMMACRRSDNRLLQSTDFHDASGRLCLRIADVERQKVIFQLGSADPAQALAAALKVQHDVAGIDLNAGCPKHFSTHGGMGAKLLSTPEKLVAILNTLCDHIQHIPISVKIRLLPDKEETFSLLKQILSTKISRLAIHFRYPSMSPSQKALWEQITPVLDFIAEQPHRPSVVLLNGDLFTSACAEKVRQAHVFPAPLSVGFMLARGAQVNPSVFATLLPESDARFRLYRCASKEIIRQILRLAARYDIPYQNAKWVTLGMWDNAQVKKTASSSEANRKRKREEVETREETEKEDDVLPPTEVSKQERIQCREAMSRSQNMQQLFAALDIEDEFQHIQHELEERRVALAENSKKEETPTVAEHAYDDMCPYVPDLRHMSETERDPSMALPVS